MHWIYDAFKNRIIRSTIVVYNFNNFVNCFFSVKIVKRSISSIMHHSVHIDPLNLSLPQGIRPLTK